MINIILMAGLAMSSPTYLETLVQYDAETKEQFLTRSALQFDAWTKQNKAEACGFIAKDDRGHLGIVMVTSHSQLSCQMRKSMIPEGMTNTGESMHSHPHTTAGRVKLTEGTWNAHPELRGVVSAPVNKHSFSGNDYKQGPGYLVSSGNLYYQNGVGTQILVQKLP